MRNKKSSWSPSPLGHLQSAVMESLWSHGPQSAADLRDALSAQKYLAYTTIHTELSRLLQKGFVVKRGRNLETRYTPAMTRDEYLQAMVRHAFSDLIGTHGAAAIHGFLEAVEGDEAALDALRRATRNRTRKQ